jgi:hypothetical protein
MFKQLIAIFFLAGLLFQNLSRFLIVADYNLNKTYITNNFCENKDKPAMHCNGKCYLSKKLMEEEKQQAPGSQKTIPEIQLFFINAPGTEIASRQGDEINATYGRHHLALTASYSRNIFRPPVI